MHPLDAMCYFMNFKEVEKKDLKKNCFGLPPEMFLKICKRLNLADLFALTRVCSKNAELREIKPLRGDLLLARIKNLPNRCYNGERNIQVYANYSGEIKGEQDFLLSCDHPSFKSLHLFLNRKDFKINRTLNSDINTSLCVMWDKTFKNEINRYYDVDSICLIDISKELPLGWKKSLQHVAATLVNMEQKARR